MFYKFISIYCITLKMVISLGCIFASQGIFGENFSMLSCYKVTKTSKNFFRSDFMFVFQVFEVPPEI